MVSYQVPQDAGAASPPPSPRVAFEETVVTGVSRPMNYQEHFALYNFETHARDCNSCRDPRRVQRHGKALCEAGHGLAVEVANLLYTTRSNTFFSTVADAGNDVRVEIPEAFLEAKDLLRAIERSVRYKERFVSMSRGKSTDARRTVERTPTVKRTKDYHRDGKLDRAQSVKKPKEHHSAEKKYNTTDKKSSRRSPEVVEWPQEERPLRRNNTVSSKPTAGSVPTTTKSKTHQYPVIINDSRTGVIAERQLHEKSGNTTKKPEFHSAEIIIEKAANTAASRGSLYLSDKAELEQREQRERKMAYNLEVREPSSPQHERARKAYRTTTDRYWR